MPARQMTVNDPKSRSEPEGGVSSGQEGRRLLLLPAIDVSGGRCVRLLQGSFSEATRYSLDPVEAARSFAGAGARWLHVVDLDAAEGKGVNNRLLIGRMRRAVSCRIEVGGGVRTEEDARLLLDQGVDRIVLGTVLAKARGEAAAWIARLGPRFVGAIDARDGRVRVAGWTADAGFADTELAGVAAAMGVRGIVYTNIARDGTLSGPDIERTNAVARAAGLPTILSGGIGRLEDVEEVAARRASLLVGVILGKALYESRVDFASLVIRFPQESGSAWDFPAE
jgi:phosphoribosylformimino-5-aminoimidazole carboxamide ribotide isomerase